MNPCREARIRRRRAAIAWAAAAAVLLVSLAPLDAPAAVSRPGIDKLVHALMYGALTGLFARAYARGLWVRIAVLLGVYGGVIEVVQHFAPLRSASWADAGANAAGISIMLMALLRTAPAKAGATTAASGSNS